MEREYKRERERERERGREREREKERERERKVVWLIRSMMVFIADSNSSSFEIAF